MSDHTFRILQYNINHGKEATMIPLLQDTKVHEFDILAIQEPWGNKLVATSYNPHDSPFYLAYPPEKESRACTYINKRIHPDHWSVTHHNKDAQTVTIRYETKSQQRTLHIHNIYNPSPSSYTAPDIGTLGTLRNCLQAPGDDHIVVGDFNLHHPLWNGLRRTTQHNAAQTLIEIARNASLSLATVRGTTTWRERGIESTIDLSFLSQSLEERLIRCTPREDMAQSSDHLPIETTLDLQTHVVVPTRKRCWKKVDLRKLREHLRQTVFTFAEPVPREQIDTYIHELTQTVTKGIDISVPWKRESPHARSFWSQECAEAVKETRKRYYEMLRSNTPESELLYKEARNRKVATIRKAKRQDFRANMAKITQTTEGIYRMAKWARQSAGKPREPPQLPQLIVTRRNERQELETTKLDQLQDKLQALAKKFFPEPTHADTSNIGDSEYPEPLDTDEQIQEKEIHEALQRVANDKAPGPDKIPNRILKNIETWLIPHLLIVFNASFRIGYHPKAWKASITLALRKHNKSDYTTVDAYRPIALLNTMGKLFEIVITRRISELTETNNLIPETQMGARRGRSTESALQLLTEQIRTIWNLPGKRQVATMLCMDISGAFDHVSHIRLLDNMKKRRLPEQLIRWVASFLSDRIAVVKVYEGETEPMEVKTGIPQGSPVSPVLFLFFIADLLDATNNEALRTSSFGFVDDTHILTYGNSTERNCRILEETHKKCEEWSRTHGSKFAPKKYELIHFAKSPKGFNMQASIKIGETEKVATSHVRVLGVQVDSKLKWQHHLAKIEEKYASQSLAISRISTSTWGANFQMARLIYTSVVRPAIAFGASIWYTPQGIATARKTIDRKLETLQNKSLRTVLGAYKAVNKRILEKETAIPPISIFLAAQTANATKRYLTGAAAETIRKACATIRNRSLSRTNHRDETHMSRLTSWSQTIIPKETWNKEIRQVATDQTSHNKDATRPRQRRKRLRIKTWNEAICNWKQQRWKEIWEDYQDSIPPGKIKAPAQRVTHDYYPKIHIGISKATTSLITQIRTEKIGLNAFLTDRRVPNQTPECSCGNMRQTAKHILMYCPEYTESRESLYKAAGTRDYSEILATPRGAKAAANWLQRTNLLPQFSQGLEP
jgi:exonuclease III